MERHFDCRNIGCAAVQLASSESPEILSMSARILVMRQGRIVDRLSGEEAFKESVLSAAIYRGSQFIAARSMFGPVGA